MKEKIIEAIRDYWNQRATGYSLDNREELENNPLEWLEIIQQIAPLKTHSRVLDIGCGPGFFSILLAKAGYQVTAIDYTDKMLEAAKQNSQDYQVEVTFKQMDGQDLIFDDEQFDLVISRNVMWNLEKPEVAYQEWLRVLRQGGKIIQFDGNYYYYLFDSNYAVKNYQSEHQHMENIDVKVMEDIARKLPLSGRLRPLWDECYLKSLSVKAVSTKVIKREDKEGHDLIRNFQVVCEK